MNRAQAANVIDHLLAGYPWADWDDHARGSWADALVETGADHEFAKGLARTWARTHEKPPSLAEFLAAVRPREHIRADPDRARVNPDVRQRMSTMWRQAIQEVTDRIPSRARGVDGHFHGGPKPCPVCNGVAKARQAMKPRKGTSIERQL